MTPEIASFCTALQMQGDRVTLKLGWAAFVFHAAFLNATTFALLLLVGTMFQ